MPVKKIDIEEIRPLLATHDNVALAEKYGVTRERVRQIRRALSGEQAGPRVSQGAYDSVVNSEDFIAGLGKFPDGELGRKFGIPVNVVFHARTNRKIPSFAETRRQEALKVLNTWDDESLMRKFGYSRAGVIALRAKFGRPDPDKPRRKRRTKAEMAAARAAAGVSAPATAPTTTVATPPLIEDVSVLHPDTLDFLARRHKAGDSTEALAARIEVPEALVKQALGLT